MPSAAGSVKNVDKTDILESDSVWTGQLTAENINATGGTIAGFEIGSSSTLRELGSDYYSVTVTRTQYSTSPVVRFNYTVSFSLTTKLEYDVMAIISLYDGETLLGSDDITIAAGSTTGIFTESEENTFIIENVSVTSVTTKADVYIYHTPYLAYNKETYNDENTGVYLGTNGIGLGAGSFYVDSYGMLVAQNAYITGDIDGGSIVTDSLSATEGKIGTITFNGNKITSSTGAALDIGITPSSYSLAYYGVVSFELDEDSDFEATLKVGIYSNSLLTNSRESTADVSLTISYGVKNWITQSKSTRQTTCVFPAGYSTYSFPISVSGGTTIIDVEADVTIKKAYGTNSFIIPSSTSGELIQVTGNIVPVSDSTYDLGTTSSRWNAIYCDDIYCSTGDWNGSDQKLKKDIEELPDSYSAIFDNIIPVRYKMKEGTADRYHTGFIAQNIEDAIIKAGLTSKDFAAYGYDRNTELRALRYSEFIALCVNEIQKLKLQLNKTTEVLETEINNLKHQYVENKLNNQL